MNVCQFDHSIGELPSVLLPKPESTPLGFAYIFAPRDITLKYVIFMSRHNWLVSADFNISIFGFSTAVGWE